MKALALALSLAALSISSPASAQSLFGLRLGDTEAQAVQRFGGRTVPLTGRPGASMMSDQRGFVSLCNGVVTGLQENIGTDLHAFTDTLADNLAKYGDPIYQPTHARTASGEFSILNADWLFDGFKMTVGYLWNGEKLSVTRSYYAEPFPCND